MKTTAALILLLLLAAPAGAQDSLNQRRNTIKIDLTSHLLYRNAIVLSYERIVRSNQSFVIGVGYQEFPKMTSFGERVGVKNERQRNGFKFGADYRFYLSKENRYAAPRGVYIGPYLTYHVFNNDRDVVVDDGGAPQDVVIDSRFSIFNAGFQVGYQFLIKNRWAIDVAFIGPSLSHYKYTMAIKGDYTFDEGEITNEILLALIDRFPLLDDVLSGDEITKKGKLDTWSFGYRYQLTVGYHFGRKK